MPALHRIGLTRTAATVTVAICATIVDRIEQPVRAKRFNRPLPPNFTPLLENFEIVAAGVVESNARQGNHSVVRL